MATKKPGPRSKTLQQAEDEDLSSSSSSLCSGFLLSPRAGPSHSQNQVPLQQQQDSDGPSASMPHSGSLRYALNNPKSKTGINNCNSSNRSAEPDSGFVTRDDVTHELGQGAGADNGGADRPGVRGFQRGSSSSTRSGSLLDTNANDNDTSGYIMSLRFYISSVYLSRGLHQEQKAKI